MSLEQAFWRITFDTNPDQCNLNCIMCEDHSPYADDLEVRKSQGRLRPIMDPQLLEKIVREAAELGFREVIPSTMGEPLLYPYFDHLLNLCEELGLSVNLTTNGTFPATKKYQTVECWAKRIIPLASDVKISWNGSSEAVQEDIMKGTNLKQHINYAQRFIAVRNQLAEQHYCSVTLQMTFMRINLEEIPDMIRLAIKLGFDRVKGHHLWDHFPELSSQSLRNDVTAIKRWNEIVQRCEEIVKEYFNSTGKALKLDNFFVLDPENPTEIALGGECPFLNREIWIDSSGRFNVCCAPDQQRKTLGDFDNLIKKNISEIINGAEYSELVKCYQEEALCKTCNMRRPV